MHKVVTERPRTGGRGKSRKTYDKAVLPKDKDDDYRPQKESMRRKHKVNRDYKQFSDLINPLYRYLEKQVGRPWDEVWSDICKVLKGNSTQAQHIKQHVKDAIKYSREVTVDDAGILRRAPKKSYKYKKPRYNYMRKGSVEYHKQNGCWYRVEIKKVTNWFTGFSYFVLNKRAINSKIAKNMGLDTHYETIPPAIKLEDTV